MRKLFPLILLLIISVFSVRESLAQPVPTGLKFLPAEQLQGIPLASTPFSGSELPGRVDLSDRMPPVGNQGNQNSCTAWAVAYAVKSFHEHLEESSRYVESGSTNPNAVFSPAFIYNQINNGADGGSSFPDALNVVSQQGAVKWRDMPYQPTDYRTRPSTSQLELAKRYRIDIWRRVNLFDLKEVKAQLNANYPVLIGAMIDRGFVDGGKGPDRHNYVWAQSSGPALGGHAMVVVGYDDARRAFKILNSWGTEWGNEGFSWISYDFFATAVREAYVMKDAVNGPNPIVGPLPDPRPTPRPERTDTAANLSVNNFLHNRFDPVLGMHMRIDGMFDLPNGNGQRMQIVVRFYYNNGQGGKGSPVGGLAPAFSMPDGTAACGTPVTAFRTGRGLTWYASMPYGALNVPRGTNMPGFPPQPRRSDLVAEPVLYVDNFAVAVGPLIPFFVVL